MKLTATLTHKDIEITRRGLDNNDEYKGTGKYTTHYCINIVNGSFSKVIYRSDDKKKY